MIWSLPLPHNPLLDLTIMEISYMIIFSIIIFSHLGVRFGDLARPSILSVAPILLYITAYLTQLSIHTCLFEQISGGSWEELIGMDDGLLGVKSFLLLFVPCFRIADPLVLFLLPEDSNDTRLRT